MSSKSLEDIVGELLTSAARMAEDFGMDPQDHAPKSEAMKSQPKQVEEKDPSILDQNWQDKSHPVFNGHWALCFNTETQLTEIRYKDTPDDEHEDSKLLLTLHVDDPHLTAMIFHVMEANALNAQLADDFVETTHELIAQTGGNHPKIGEKVKLGLKAAQYVTALYETTMRSRKANKLIAKLRYKKN